MQTPIVVERHDSPILLGFPHDGTYVPPEIEVDLNICGKKREDTDWHIHKLYSGLFPEMTSVRTRIHRYVIDVNRDPRDISLYPDQNTTSLVPLTNFDGEDIWKTQPSALEIEHRVTKYYQPYHTAVEFEIQRIKNIHGFAIFWDCHSIRSRIPFLFDGTLPDFNIGTASGASCALELESRVTEQCCSARDYSTVLNGRFKGGWCTRHFGRPKDGIHAIQMEVAQSTYLHSETAPWVYDKTKARKLRSHLKTLLELLADWHPIG